ncbi:hypothetical protein HK101_012042, partial [Irineochytrium annulatum]
WDGAVDNKELAVDMTAKGYSSIADIVQEMAAGSMDAARGATATDKAAADEVGGSCWCGDTVGHRAEGDNDANENARRDIVVAVYVNEAADTDAAVIGDAVALNDAVVDAGDEIVEKAVDRDETDGVESFVAAMHDTASRAAADF